MPNAVVLMTALVPTVGHKYLIDYARNLTGWGGVVNVIVGTLDREPVKGVDRFMAFVKTYLNDTKVKIHWLDRDVPQEPSEHPDFGMYGEISFASLSMLSLMITL